MLEFIVLDTETTGFDPKKDRIIEIALIHWQDGKILKRFESLVNPKIKLPQEITLLTGITQQEVEDGRAFSDIKEEVQNFIGDHTIIGHNIQFDLGFLTSHGVKISGDFIDTITLARMLLQKESSYALEVLMKKYRLPLKEAHRAMADTETTAAFFDFLLKKIGEIPKELLSSINDVLSRTTWSGQCLFKEPLPSASFEKLSCHPEFISGSSSMQKHPYQILKQVQNDNVAKLFVYGGKILFESTASIPFEKFKGAKKIVVAYASPRTRNHILKQAPEASQLKEPTWYLSPKKLRLLCLQESIPAEEAPFIVKMMLWAARTETGDREELSLEREEYAYFEKVCDGEGQDVFWGRAIEKAAQSGIVLIHQYGFCRGLHLRIPDVRERGLIVLDASRLEDSFTAAHAARMTELHMRSLGERVTLAWGLLGIFYERMRGADPFGDNEAVMITTETRESHHWKRFIDALENLPDGAKKRELQEITTSRENFLLWVSSFANEVFLHSAPKNLSAFFEKMTAPFASIILQSAALSDVGDFVLTRRLFDLDDSWKILREENNESILAADRKPCLKIIIMEKFPEPSSSGHFKQCLNLFAKLLQEKHGRLLFIVSSKKAAASFSQALGKIALEAQTRLFAVGQSGGLGKTVALFKEHPDASAILATNQIIPLLPEIEDELNVVVFQKIPFDPPFDPVFKTRAAFFENGFEHYSLPRAVMKFRELLAELGHKQACEPGQRQKTCYLLDSRLLTREYGRFFI